MPSPAYLCRSTTSVYGPTNIPSLTRCNILRRRRHFSDLSDLQCLTRHFQDSSRAHRKVHPGGGDPEGIMPERHLVTGCLFRHTDTTHHQPGTPAGVPGNHIFQMPFQALRRLFQDGGAGALKLRCLVAMFDFLAEAKCVGCGDLKQCMVGGGELALTH